MTTATAGSMIGHLTTPPTNEAVMALFDDDLAEVGFVMNVSRLWAYQPATLDALFELMSTVISMHGISFRRRGIIVAACASTFGDSYCSLAWGTKLASVSDEETAAAVLRGEDGGLTDDERALATWARKVARDPNATTSADVQQLREAGYVDAQIFAITVFIGLRLALSSVNDALGIGPDAAYKAKAPRQVLDAVTFGRPTDAGVH
jgi:uncharacterized peroxidase-related enzyme